MHMMRTWIYGQVAGSELNLKARFSLERQQNRLTNLTSVVRLDQLLPYPFRRTTFVFVYDGKILFP